MKNYKTFKSKVKVRFKSLIFTCIHFLKKSIDLSWKVGKYTIFDLMDDLSDPPSSLP